MNSFTAFYKKFYNESIVNKLISINVLVFLITLFLPASILVWFMMPIGFLEFSTQPWSIISSMFMHSGLMHIAFNMLWLWSLGKMLLRYISEKEFIKLYFYGGILAAIGVLFYGYIFGVGGYAVGASGAISSIIFATIFITPNQKVNLFGIVQVKMKWIAWVLIGVNLFGLTGGNAGGEVAHIIGSIFGYVWMKNHFKRDILKDILNF